MRLRLNEVTDHCADQGQAGQSPGAPWTGHSHDHPPIHPSGFSASVRPHSSPITRNYFYTHCPDELMGLRNGKGFAQVMWLSEEETYTFTSLISPRNKKAGVGAEANCCPGAQRRADQGGAWEWRGARGPPWSTAPPPLTWIPAQVSQLPLSPLPTCRIEGLFKMSISYDHALPPSKPPQRPDDS